MPTVPLAGPSQPAPPVAMPLPLFPYGDFFLKAIGYGTTGGAALGAIYGGIIGLIMGAASGSLLLFPVVAAIGGIIGSIAGLVLGLVLGLLLGLISWLFFYPLHNTDLHHSLLSLLAPIFTLVVAQLFYTGFQRGSSLYSGSFFWQDPTTLAFYALPAMIAAGYAAWVAWRLADWYAHDFAWPTLPSGPAMYEPAYLRTLFDEMHSSYERVNAVTSFGFARRWRREVVRLAPLQPGMHVLDLMCGSGELWEHLLPRLGPTGRVTGVDFSTAAIEHARRRRRALPNAEIALHEIDALRSNLPAACADAALCVYGVKTLSPADQERFGAELRRLLRPNGVFALVEIELPRNTLLRLPYLAYLSLIVPLVGRLLLGNPENYRMLGRYLRAYQGADALAARLTAQGFTVHRHDLFLGCAAVLVGMRDGEV